MLAIWLFAQAHLGAQAPAVSAVVFPADGAANADYSQPIQWTAVSGAQAYYLYVGTAAGASDLINTGETLQTSYPAAKLPANQRVFARIWTKVAGIWHYADSTFSGDVLTTRIRVASQWRGRRRLVRADSLDRRAEWAEGTTCMSAPRSAPRI